MSKLLILLLTAVSLAGCAGTPDESPEVTQAREERRNEEYDKKMEKKRIRRDAADQRYDKWWDAAMGRDKEGYSQW